MKITWILLDILVSGFAIYFLFVFGGWQCVALGLGLALWNFIDGHVRANW